MIERIATPNTQLNFLFSMQSPLPRYKKCRRTISRTPCFKPSANKKPDYPWDMAMAVRSLRVDFGNRPSRRSAFADLPGPMAFPLAPSGTAGLPPNGRQASSDCSEFGFVGLFFPRLGKQQL